MFKYSLFKNIERVQNGILEDKRKDCLCPYVERGFSDRYQTYASAFSYIYNFGPEEKQESIQEVEDVLNDAYSRLYCEINPFVIAKHIKSENPSYSYIYCLREVESNIEKYKARHELEIRNHPYIYWLQPIVKKAEKGLKALNKEIKKLTEQEDKQTKNH